MTHQTEALAELIELIASDSYAISFQTMGQYRTALLKAGRAALSSQPPAPSWQPIETAPKDGTRILVWPWCGKVDHDYWSPTDDNWLPGVTHWMPLPAPPASLTATAGSTP